jgi:hydrocephalus-inducing protein
VDVTNTEGREWAINPTISTELEAAKGFFTGPSRLTVPANGKATYEVTYQPTIMTKMKKIKSKNENDEEVEEEVMDTHKATLFFPLPNGTALLYKLSGTATEPDAEDSIEEKATAKKVKSLLIPMKNWSRQS